MRKIFSFLAFSIIFISCRKDHPSGNSASNQVALFSAGNASRTAGTADSERVFIPIDTANAMISSYLNSINYQSNDSEIRSMVIDADALRTYLNSPAGQGISQMKVMFAHTMDYVNRGGKNKRSGYRASAFTIILAGFNDDGDYIYYKNSMVPDHSNPCPNTCPTVGAAASNLLSQ